MTLCYPLSLSLLAVVVCLSVCLSVHPSVTSWYCIETTEQIELVLAWELPPNYLSYTVLWGNLGNSKIKVVSFGSSSQTLDKKSSPRKVDLVVNKTRRQSSSLTTTIRIDALCLDAHSLLHLHFGRLKPSNSFVVDLLYNFVLQLCGSWQDFDWNGASE